MNIDFVFDNEVDNFENNYEQDFIAIIEQALKILGIEDDVEVSCVLVDDERIHEINREYRHIDRSTDVISFAMEDNDQFYVEGMPRTLGDIFISVDHAKKQAEEYGHSLRREMCFLFTHGILHLLGYDHMTDEQEKEMFGLQDEILGALSIEREGV
ncbi:rRNA maturation RNase YbeY [Catenibacterium mitsuokai]|uniref:rRNA maturation RNase YbeY n=1 Tax=Catenibacterium mitsuokai TaxID=100886 RepID=UPI003F89DF1C